ncbi:hypothetical protein K438DRAFT_1834091 [Mycena galopus ATCC 62051]|nr:hypothetical protein K438DRAFT_1834091 [Mycena galopus ATCC 62051]
MVLLALMVTGVSYNALNIHLLLRPLVSSYHHGHAAPARCSLAFTALLVVARPSQAILPRRVPRPRLCRTRLRCARPFSRVFFVQHKSTSSTLATAQEVRADPQPQPLRGAIPNPVRHKLLLARAPAAEQAQETRRGAHRAAPTLAQDVSLFPWSRCRSLRECEQ